MFTYKQKTKRIELTMSVHLITAMVNSDESGLNEEDIKAIDRAIKYHGPVFHIYCPDETETDFTRCDLTGLISDCLTVTVDVSK